MTFDVLPNVQILTIDHGSVAMLRTSLATEPFFLISKLDLSQKSGPAPEGSGPDFAGFASPRLSPPEKNSDVGSLQTRVIG
jgi:hypothetical protein